MTFNIGSQSGGVFNNVGGDQHITGGQQAMSVHGPAGQAVEQLRAVLAELRLDPRTAAAVRGEVEEIDAAVRVAPQPDRQRVAASMERLTRTLSAAGALSTAGAALLTPLRELAGWLGPMGVHVLGMLPGRY